MPVGLTVGGWFASSIVGKLLDSLKSYATYQYRWQLGLEEERERLEEALPRIQALLDAVDSGHVPKEKNSALEEWMWQFRDAVEEAEDFMDEVEYYRLENQIKGERSKVSQVVSLLKTTFKRALHKDCTLERLKGIVRRLDKAIAGIVVFVDLVDTLKHKQSLITSNRDTTSLLPVEHKVVGRGDEKHNIINKLLSFSSASVRRRNFSILPIVGVGGIGKTTLAQFVYNDEGIEKHFQKRMWVCVSNTFDVLSLTKKIYELVVDKTHTANNLDLLQREVLESLRSKRVLLVLDDVWNDDDRESWGKLLAPFSSVEDGSMILLTTRMEKVTKMVAGTMEPIFLKGMGEEDYWEFFKNCAFGDEDPKHHNKLQDIGRKIAEKLKGSPLAAKTVGGILRSNLADEHWENILNSEIWQLKQCENDIMPALGLSYQHLSSHLKPCFRFCSIFPQDYEFGKEELVYLWMALGLVQKPINGIRRPEDIGEEYLNELVGKSFFDCKTGLHTYYVMHDLLHELATSVSYGECFRIENSCEHISIPKTVRHLSINTSLTLPIPEIAKLKYLRTLLLLEESNPSYCHIPEVLKGLRSLRILESSGFYITDDCFSHLKHLRLLRSGSYISPVFESLNKLYHLQFLYYQQNDPHSNKLYPPDFINNLINLRRLSTPNSLIGNVSGIGRLTSLQILDCFSVKKENGNNVKEEYGNNLFELKNLRELRELGIQNLQRVTSVEEVAEAKLNDKEHLQTLTLKWDFNHIYDSGSRGSPEVEEQVLDALQPHSNLKNLKIGNYLGRRSPCWMTPQSLSKLVYIKLHDCQGWEDLPPLGELPFLESLQLFSMDSVKRVGGPPDRGTEVSVFPSLRVLYIKHMQALEEFYGGTKTSRWLPSLKSLSIIRCPKLRMFLNLPCGLGNVYIESVNWTALPELRQGGPSTPLSPSLSSLEISDGRGLVSLAKGLLLHPERFTSLEKLSICGCGDLTHLPIAGFEKFTALKELRVMGCPKLQRGSTTQRFLPLSLQCLAIEDCNVLDALPKIPEDLNFLSEVKLKRCGNIKSLPSAQVLGRWKALKRLSIEECSELRSLGGLQALSSLKYLTVEECPKLLAAPSSSPSTLAVENSSSLMLEHLVIDNPSVLSTVPLKSIAAREVYIGRCNEVRSSALEGWALRNRTSLQVLKMGSVFSRQFPLADLQSLSCLKRLGVDWCRKLQSLPKLPASLNKLCLYFCSPELEERCLRDSGPDWPKIRHIPYVQIGKYNKEKLATITPAEHRSRTRELEEDSS